MNVPESRPSPPSSIAYGTELVPAAALRLKVLAAGWLALLAGLAIVAHLELSIPVKVSLAVIWIVDLGRTLARQALAQARVRRLTATAQGPWLAHLSDGKIEEIQVLGDSVIGRRLAWLRLRFGDGRAYGELVTRASVGDEAWRRLAVIVRWGLPPNDK